MKNIFFEIDHKSLYEFLLNNVDLDLLKGPYFIGSTLIHEAESFFNIPSWSPHDIDIVSRSFDQKDRILEILKNIGLKHYTKPQENTTCIDFTVYDASAQDYLKNNLKFSITKIARDKNNWLFSENCLEHIKNKKLFSSEFISNGAFRRKYYKRGYKDA